MQSNIKITTIRQKQRTYNLDQTEDRWLKKSLKNLPLIEYKLTRVKGGVEAAGDEAGDGEALPEVDGEGNIEAR